MLRKSPDVVVKVIDPFGWQPIIALNHLNPPFDNPKLRRALLPALDQKAFVAAVIGEQTELGHVPGGFFADGQPMATHAGLEVLTRPRDLKLAKQLVSESGYGGEPVVLLSASDRPVYSAVSQVTRALFQALGLTVDFQAMDWGSVITRGPVRVRRTRAVGAPSSPPWMGSRCPIPAATSRCGQRQEGLVWLANG